jgi:CRISPR-associated protein Cas8a1/Csx13
MAKAAVKKAAKRAAKPSTSFIEMDLFAPGMTAIHRAGLGGLVCTLNYIERARCGGILDQEEIPGHWELDERRVRLDFESPENARVYLQKLFSIAFQLKDGLIYLPGQYDHEPSLAVRAELQSGMTTTFLQHGRTRSLGKTPCITQSDVDGDGRNFITIEYRRCESYAHQCGWEALTSSSGLLAKSAIEVAGPLNPGAVVRHVAFNTASRITDPPERILPLYFAIVGCLSLRATGGGGVLVIPEVDNLRRFMVDRPMATPSSTRECRVTSAGDAALQAAARLRGRSLAEDSQVPGSHTTIFKTTAWASQQKSRTAVLSWVDNEIERVQPDVSEDVAERRLRQFEVALAVLPNRVAERTRTGKGKDKKSHNVKEGFFIESLIRPHIADNLARGRPWYENFRRLFIANDANGSKLLHRLSYESAGLNAMIKSVPWDDESERLLVEAVHKAMQRNYAIIAVETNRGRLASSQPTSQGKVSPATQNRWNRFEERLRLSLIGAKTPQQCSAVLANLFGKAGSNEILRENWQKVLPLLHDPRRWQSARDLALLALASYSSSSKEKSRPDVEPSATSEADDIDASM